MQKVSGDPNPAEAPTVGGARQWLKAIGLFCVSFAVAWPIARWQLGVANGARPSTSGASAGGAPPAGRVSGAESDPTRSSGPTPPPAVTSSALDTSDLSDASASGGAAPAARSDAASRVPSDTTACLEAWAPGAFGTSNPLDWVCAQPNLWSLQLDLHARVRREGQGEGARLWLELAHYEFGAIAVLRGLCCPNAPPLVAPVPTRHCPPLESVLANLGRSASVEHTNAYAETLQCLIHRQVQMPASWEGAPEEQARTAFDTFLRHHARHR